MTPAKYQSALNAQSAIAKKVLEMVPIQEAWSRNEIASNMRRVTKSSPDVAVLDGCIARLKDAGLIRERQTGLYQRVEIREREIIQVATAKAVESGSLAVESAKSPIDILSSLSERARQLATSIVMLASDIETAALTIEQGSAESNANLEKLRQLQALLKSLS
ncbi:hypothetical protein [Paraburkholderia sp. BL21I4N1]|uniref:hypothetical protein n=1 Tax=Paraburkholderia sp. BL21I4N1 TaxID=1938801 RepID=UPI000CFC51F1|nr:hypothetical protein [Paraburkholderia sp. BL21I4N1]PQV50991.1 hypothetical protein B0G83_105354 [Paraburkholderia sp. BL21I4N1]